MTSYSSKPTVYIRMHLILLEPTLLVFSRALLVYIEHLESCRLLVTVAAVFRRNRSALSGGA